METLLIVAAAAVLIGMILRRKFRQDGIHQGGVRVGSALLGGLVGPAGTRVSFAIIRGEILGDRPFREGEPFMHRGTAFRILSVAARDDRSPVLLRLRDVVCRVEASETT